MCWNEITELNKNNYHYHYCKERKTLLYCNQMEMAGNITAVTIE
ncbi:hypothetical protein CLOSTHATH_02183 [Hungatella hathewayi DSM 13479]|uniref:Uncharacterized protein n=1 Tax=Hungatella hathewayi DSM 13479 TaxID=566550 RepID=D3AEZ9_9FIRM|nr:hypothetical protein CLOSTHATH_02183 [Hungatella hathewayi DSM 13479]